MNSEHFGYKQVGFKFATDCGYITATDLDLYCGLLNAREDIFLRDDSAKEMGMGTRIVPGYLLCRK